MGIFDSLGLKNPGVTVVNKIAKNTAVNKSKNPVLPKGPMNRGGATKARKSVK